MGPDANPRLGITLSVLRMKTTSIPLAVALLVSFSPWILGARLFLSFGGDSRTAFTDQVRYVDSSHIKNVIANKHHGNPIADGDGSFMPLSEAILFSRTDGVRASLVEGLIRYGAQVNEPTFFSTPLETAAYKNDIEMMRLLVRHGADVDFPNCHGVTPLMTASMAGNKEAIAELLSLGAKIGIRDSQGRTARDMASKEEVRLVLDASNRRFD